MTPARIIAAFLAMLAACVAGLIACGNEPSLPPSRDLGIFDAQPAPDAGATPACEPCEFKLTDCARDGMPHPSLCYWPADKERGCCQP